MATTNNQIQIELHVPDFDIALAFYKHLGFEVVWTRRTGDVDDYMVLARDGMILNFWPGNEHVYDQSYFKSFPKDTPRGYGVEIVLMVEDVRGFHDKIGSSVKIVNPLVKRPWGLWDFRIVDPFGYYIRVTEKHDILDPANAVQ